MSGHDTQRQAFRDAVTTLAGSLNHEINSPLTSILGNTQLLLLHPSSQDPEVEKKLRTIEHNVLRIKHIIERIARVAEPVYSNYPGGIKILDLDESTPRAPEQGTDTP